MAELNDGDRARVRRIRERADADCAASRWTAGTGAQSTRKRALAVEMAMGGAAVEAIRAATALSEQRVRQILANFDAHGVATLYPTFEEPLGEPSVYALAQMLRDVLEKSPQDHGYDIGREWLPASLLDHLVQTGAIEDSNLIPIVVALSTLDWRKAKDEGQFSWESSWQYEARMVHRDAGCLLVLFVVALIPMLLGGVFMFSRSCAMIPIGAILLLIGGLAMWTSVYWLLRNSREQKFLRSMTTKASQAGAWKPPEGAVAQAASPPTVVIRHVNTLPPTTWSLEAISEASNATGAKPVSILYLWVFQRITRHLVFQSHGWPQVGPVHLLLNTEALNLSDIRRGLKLLTEDRAELTAALARLTNAPGLLPFPKLYGAFHGKYRGYPINTLVCTDAVWRDAFQELASRSDLAVFNLSGYTREHAGIEYELFHVLNGGIPRSLVFMFDTETDADAAIDWVLRGWEKFAGAKRAATPLVFMRYGFAQNFGYALQFRETIVRQLGQAGFGESTYQPIAGSVADFLGVGT